MDDNLETFFVYRSLSPNESWGTLLGVSPISFLPNADFVMRVFAKNEKEAITRARLLYEAIHKYDSDKDNVRRFACAALKVAVINQADPDTAAEWAMTRAVAMNRTFNKHFAELDVDNNLPELIEQAERERNE